MPRLPIFSLYVYVPLKPCAACLGLFVLRFTGILAAVLIIDNYYFDYNEVISNLQAPASRLKA